ncbi:hypothetical protein Dsin_008433 [Dipteronia sinensis]|uniref:Uncharacterized protein n=1 Tax=Dipteronia sinensis TaxID=43782 RepID=A0AAE0EAN5_9ROSI|nr:hypothetical protein Dsin_008433 [Dipteronia sinensis]
MQVAYNKANGRRSRNRISEISFGGKKVSDPIHIREGVRKFFRKLFSNVRWKHPLIKGLNLHQISEGDRKALEEAFSEEEVWAAVNACGGSKALGPDGLNFHFVKANWEMIKLDFMRFIQDFHRNGNIVKELNNTFIALIPKVSHPKTMKEF